MSFDTLSEFVEATATKFRIPGVAVGVWADGREVYACHGVTSVDNPLPVDRDTLFLLGSVTKTYTATALLRLVADGRVELDARCAATSPSSGSGTSGPRRRSPWRSCSTTPQGWTGD
jgi:CubicO group peptidase (beta-lactamase class C family)